MVPTPEIDNHGIGSPVEQTPGTSRRTLVKRLALLAATGYLAPKAVMISRPWACNNKSQPNPHGGSISGPFCV